jgi:SAM-dependent methyltransferase
VGPAERLPWADGEFDRVLSQLVLPFVTDADLVMAEMRRVVRRTGTVAACMWGANDEMELVGLFWRAASRVDTGSPGDKIMRFRNRTEIEDLFRRGGFSTVESAPLDVTTTYATFDEFWSSIEGSAGTVGAYVATLDAARLSELRESCHAELGAPKAHFTLRARAWAVRA